MRIYRLLIIAALAIVLLPRLAQAGIAVSCTSHAQHGDANNPTNGGLTISTCNGSTSGLVYIAEIGHFSTSTITASPSGWTHITGASGTESGGTDGSDWYWHASVGSETATYSWTCSAGCFASGGLVAYSGVNTTTPIDASSVHAISTATTTLVANSVNTNQAGDYVVAGCTFNNAASETGWTGGLGTMNQEWFIGFSSGNFFGSSAADVAGPGSATSTGNITLTVPSSFAVCSQVALAPAVVPTATPTFTPAPTNTPTSTATFTPTATATPAPGYHIMHLGSGGIDGGLGIKTGPQL